MVRVQVVHTVVPAVPTAQPCLWLLSNIDLIANAYVKQVQYYKSNISPSDFKDLVDALKNSLSSVLVHFHPLAGEAQAAGGRVVVNCNDQGIPLHIATTEARLENARKCEIEAQLVPQDEFVIAEGVNSPLIQIQLTRFSCGSIALGYAASETVADGHSSFQFLQSWSEVHRGLPLSSPPIFNLGVVLESRKPPQVKIPARDYTVAEGWATINYKKKITGVVFTISEDKVSSLVKEVEDGPFGYGRATSFQAMAALVWKCMTEARQLDDESVTKYMYAISFRNNPKRWDPVIPAGSIGNAVHMACLPALAGDIKANHLSFAANLIRQDINSISMETIRSGIDWMQLQMNKGLKVGFNCDVYKGTDVYCTSLYTFPLYETEFGFGKPVHFSVDQCFGDGVVFMLSTPDRGRNREIAIALPQASMERLLENSLFRSFATPLN